MPDDRDVAMIEEPKDRAGHLRMARNFLLAYQGEEFETPEEAAEAARDLVSRLVREVEGALAQESKYHRLWRETGSLSNLLYRLQSRSNLKEMDEELAEVGVKLDDLWGRVEAVEKVDPPDPGVTYPLGHPVAFISGHLDLTDEEFEAHYKPQLEEAARNGAHFIVGDARGADFLAQVWLHRNVRSRRVTVFHMHTAPRHCVGFRTRGGFPTDRTRDEAMTKRSTFDIAWVRPGRESSGTAKNLARRSG